MVVDKLGNFKVKWTASDKDIQLCLTAKTRGYIGFGLSENARLNEADIDVG